MGAATVVAMALRYPGPGRTADLRTSAAEVPEGQLRRELERFCETVSRLDLGDWEELHTRTLDLSPLFVPYVGHVTWGESYRRGAFMADLKRAQDEAGVDREGELPDHLGPVLRLLDVLAPADLVEVLPAAIRRMQVQLREADRSNPYRHVLAAAGMVADDAAGGSS